MLQNILPRIGFLVVAIVILFVSMTKASLNLMAVDDNVEVLKNNELSFVAVFGDGDTEVGNYKFPEVGMLPSNAMYGFKRIRDYLWLAFSQGLSKAELAIFLADKKIIEFTKLCGSDLSNNDRAIEAGNEAIDKLEYTNGILVKTKLPDEKAKQLRKQLFWAGLAYKEIIVSKEKFFQFETEKYSNLVSRINEWNKEQEKNRYSWDF